MKKLNKRRLSLLLIWFSIVLFITSGVLITISFFSNTLITKLMRYILMGVAGASFIILIIGIIMHHKNKYQLRFKKWIPIVISILITLYAIGCSGFLFMLYGPYAGFREWLITTAMGTMHHQHYCKWFYSDKYISSILDNNYIEEFDEDTDASMIDFSKEIVPRSDLEKQILNHNKKDIYKLIRFEINGCNAYLVAVYDPSKIHLAVTKWLGTSGQWLWDMAEENDALLAINGGGFVDPGNSSNGGVPAGITIKNKKSVYSAGESSSIIGFNSDNVLMLTKNHGMDAALKAGYRDAVSMHPFLIVNGKPAFIRGNGGWGYAARTAIGQREDGIVLFLVVDCNQFRSKGATMVDLTEIMQECGAINAANLDGGTSTGLVLPRKVALKYKDKCLNNNADNGDAYCLINDPIDSAMRHRSRGLPTAWIITKD